MTFFSSTEPILRRKQVVLHCSDLIGLWQIRWRLGRVTLFEADFTRVDQVFVGWGLLTGLIFGTAQFLALDWSVQAVVWSLCTVLGAVGMVALCWCWVMAERVVGLVAGWVGLLALGLMLTNVGILTAWEPVVLHLGPLWLTLSALGYLGTGVRLRSRALVLAGVLHGLCAAIFYAWSDWQFLGTGTMMSVCLLLLGLCQWDMHLVAGLLPAQQSQRKP
ncbi:hypothetical protein [Anthocerotibacter panamensis]|uniref:hypothetical protein n=1 Tax=Anthocerotibacter panamensis TaxID=2857077 RepID=UPI001C407CA5|nr:hypothetical protein [Anthocerotibacter panamensis]